jgi:hypothetical protein
MTHLTRLLLWGDFDAAGRLTAAFRVTEDQTCADIHDAPYRPQGPGVGIVHPLQLTEEERARWGEVFSDYEIIAPFPQLGRRIHTLQPGEEGKTELRRFGEKAIPAIVLDGILKQQGWMVNRLASRGTTMGHYKRFPEADLTAILEEAYAAGDGLEIRSAFFVAGFPEDGGRSDARKALRLGEVDPLILSEVLGILNVLASKGT